MTPDHPMLTARSLIDTERSQQLCEPLYSKMGRPSQSRSLSNGLVAESQAAGASATPTSPLGALPTSSSLIAALPRPSWDNRMFRVRASGHGEIERAATRC